MGLHRWQHRPSNRGEGNNNRGNFFSRLPSPNKIYRPGRQRGRRRRSNSQEWRSQSQHYSLSPPGRRRRSRSASPHSSSNHHQSYNSKLMNGGINGFPLDQQQQQMIIRQDTNSSYRSAKSKSTSSTYSSSSTRSNYSKLQQYRGSSSSCIPPSFQIPKTKQLSIHSTIYNYLFITYCISITSLSQAIQRPTSSNEKLVIGCISINLIVSFVLCIGYRYTPFRKYIVDTKLYLPSICRFRYYQENDSSLLDGGITIELVVAMVLYLFQLLSFGIITTSSGSSYLGIDNNYHIWNNNLYHGTWVSMMLSSFLIADLLTTDTQTRDKDKDGGLIAKYTTQYMQINTISRSYLLLLISTICLLSFSTSQMSTSTTNRAIGITFGTLGLIIAMIYWLLCLYTNRRRDYWLLHPRGSSQLVKIDSNKTLISFILSCIGFICYSINAGLITSGNYSANVYFSSWICFGICIYLCIQHFKIYMVPSSQLYIHSLMQVYDDERRNILLSSRRRSSYSSRSSYSRSSSQEGGRLMIQGDDALTAMVESRSEDGPMVFLPIENGNNRGKYDDDDDDASYPSVSPRYLRRPQGQQQMEPEDSVNGIRRQQVPTRSAAPQGPRQGNSGGGSNHTPPPKRQNTQGTGGSLTSDFVETMYSERTPPGSFKKIMPPPPPRRNSGDYSMSNSDTSIGRKSRSSSKSPQSFDSPSRRRRSKSPNPSSRRTQSPRSFRSYESPSRKTSVKSSPSFNNSRASSRSSLDDGTSYGPSTVSGGGSRGPSTASFGAATMSASGDGSRSEKKHENDDHQGEKITMGRIQPRAPPPPPPPQVEEEEENEEDYYDANGFDIRPFKTIHHSSLENMSTVSDISHPSADRFDTFHEPRGNTNKGATTRNNVEGSDQKLRYSNEDLNEGQTNVRQGAVDQMVMEALRQASNRGPSNPPPPSQGLLPAGMSKGNRRNSTGSRVSFSKDIKETMIYNADLGINSGGQQQRNGASMRSFYSHQSGAASYDDDDAGDEYDC